MHGFLGYVEPDADAGRAMARWMRAWIGLAPAKQALEACPEGFSYLASVEPDWDDEAVAQEGELTLVFHGFIARDQLAGADGGPPTCDAAVARALLARYRKYGVDSLAGLNGRYVVAVWDAQARRLELANDVLGLLPVFLWQEGGSLAFASHIWPIACHPRFRRDVNPLGMADLLIFSHQQLERTLFECVSVLPAGAVTTWQDGALHSRCVCEPRYSDERWGWGIEKTAACMQELLARSVERRVPDDAQVRLPLSGGLDSRALLGFLARRPLHVLAVSQGQHGALGVDSRYAQRMARLAGTEFRPVPLRDDFLAAYRAKCVAVNSGMYDIHTGRFLSLFEQSADQAMPTVSGHLGGEMTGRFHIPDVRFTTPEQHFELAFREENMFRFPPAEVSAMLAAGVAGDVAEQSLQESRRLFLEQSRPHWQRFWQWDLLQYRRRYDSYMLLYFGQFHKVLAPFYDAEFLDFMFSLSWVHLEEQRAYCEMHRRAFPKLARVPNTNTDRPPQPSARFILGDFLNTQYMRFVRRPLQRLLRLRRWVPQYCIQLSMGLAGESRAVLDDVLAGRELASPYLDPDRVADAVARQLAGDHTSPFGLMGLSSFITALRFAEAPWQAIEAWQPDRVEAGEGGSRP